MYLSIVHCKGVCTLIQFIPLGVILPFIDIIIFAVIAVLLVLRLRSILGQRSGYEEQAPREVKHNRNSENVIPIDGTSAPDENDGHGLEALRKADQSFSENQFLNGAASAFEMILRAYAEDDQAQLKRLLNYELLQSFAESIRQRSSDGETLTISVDNLHDVQILDAKVFDNIASVVVRFHSTQTRVLVDSDDVTIEDEDTGTRDIIDVWTFERDLTLDDPNWKLAETETPDEE